MSSDWSSKAFPWLAHGAAAVFYGAIFTSLALLGSRVVYEPRHLALLVATYLGLGLLLHGIAQAMARYSAALAPLACLAIATLGVLQLREQLRQPQSWLATALSSCLVAVAVCWLERRLTQRWPLPSSPTVPTLLGALFFVLVLAVSWFASPTQRWHLLRHNTLIGTPLYYLAAEPVPRIREALFDRHRSSGPGGTPSEETPPDERRARSSDGPHIVWLMVDTLRADSLGAWREPGAESRMPYFDALAERSLRFVDVVANSSWTRPSVASMFTGLLPEEHGARDLADPLEPELETIAEVLSGRGYQTAAFVANIAATGREAGFAQGFEPFVEVEGTPYATVDRVNQRVSSFLRQWSERPAEERRRPLLLYAHYLDPHEPYLSSDPPSRETPAEYRRAYDAELLFFDREMQGLMPQVFETLGDDTVVIVSSDHGEEFFEHGLFGHAHSLYDEVVHVPLLVHYAGSASGETLEQRLEGRDLFSLVLQLADRSPLAPWATERCRDERYLSLYYTGTGRLLLRPYRRHTLMRATDRAGHRLIWSAYGDTRELYDQVKDPAQLRNVYSEHPTLAIEMERNFAGHPKSWRFPTPIEASGRTHDQLRALGYVD